MKRMIPVDDLEKWIEEENYYISRQPLQIQSIRKGIYDPLRQKIKSMAIEFDDDGWCHDLDKMPKDAEVLVFDGISVFTALKYVYPVGRGRGYSTNYYASVDSEVPYCGYCEHSFREFTPKAWRPLPDFPEVKK